MTVMMVCKVKVKDQVSRVELMFVQLLLSRGGEDPGKEILGYPRKISGMSGKTAT